MGRMAVLAIRLLAIQGSGSMRKPAKSSQRAGSEQATETTRKVIRCLEQLAARDTATWNKGAKGLRKLGPAATPALIAILTGRDPSGRDNPPLRRLAASAMYLCRIADRTAAQALVEAMKDSEPTVRSAAAQALTRVARA